FYDLITPGRAISVEHPLQLRQSPFDAVRIATQDVSPSFRLGRRRHEEKSPRFGSGPVIGLAEGRCAVGGRTLGSVGEQVDRPGVGEIVDFSARAINRFLEAN